MNDEPAQFQQGPFLEADSACEPEKDCSSLSRNECSSLSRNECSSLWTKGSDDFLSMSDHDDLKMFPPIAGFLPDDGERSKPAQMPAPDSDSKINKKIVQFPDDFNSGSICQPLASLITFSTPVPPSHRRLHHDAVYNKFIEFLERGRPTRRFIREGLFNWRRRVFSSKKELVVHLFSDIICFSKKDAGGCLYLIQKFKLKQCRIALEFMTLTITCGNSVMAVAAAHEHTATAWFNDIQALTLWCQKGEIGIMPVMVSPDLEVAFASAHSRSISAALREELIGKADIQTKSTSHSRSTSVLPAPTTEKSRRISVQRSEMGWNYAFDQMHLKKSAMKTVKYADILHKDRLARAEKQKAVMADRLMILRAGDFLFKYDRSGCRQQRFYQVDGNGEILSWSKSKSSITTSSSKIRF